MKRTIVFVLILAVVLSFGDTLNVKNEIYIIKEGDCLWNIAKAYYSNPFLWPKIWENNGYIKNPDLIFPDDQLVIPDVSAPAEVETEIVEEVKTETKPETTPAETVVTETKPETSPAETVVTEPIPEPVVETVEEVTVEEEKEPVTETVKEEELMLEPVKEEEIKIVKDEEIPITYDNIILQSGGIIQESEIGKDGYLVGFEDIYKSFHSEAETAFINLYGPAAVGDVYMIYTLEGNIKDPQTKASLGKKLVVRGLLTVSAVEEGVTKAYIKKSFTNLTAGFSLVKYQPENWLYFPEKDAPSVKEGVIAGLKDENDLIGKIQDIIYVNLGKGEGVKQGQEFLVLKKTRKMKDPEGGSAETDMKEIGLIRIVKVFEYTSAAVILKINDIISTGDPVVYKEF